MAKVCSVIVGLCCLSSCLILICASFDTKSIDYDTYVVTSNLEDLKPYSVNIRRKRQVPLTILEDSKSKQTNETSTETAQLAVNKNSDESLNRSSSTNNSKTGVSVSLSKSINGTLDDRPLLGVNGTGQRKNLTKPFTVSDPIDSTDSTSKSSKPIKLNSSSNPTDDILEEVDVSDEETHRIAEQNNITQFKESYFVFYNSTTSVDPERVSGYWDDFKNLTINAMLSKSHRRAITVQLTFDFPFYGHPVRNVTVATGGFFYTGEYVHSWLAATQYIAPLMANFDTSISNSSFVRFNDNGTSFTVLWENVSLQDRQEVGQFTFSVTLHETGDIVFAYYSLPMLIETIQDDKHPVKIGLSDAYIIDKTIFFARRKTIYEYHRVNFDGQDISNNTVIVLRANPTCHSLTDCESCSNSESTLSFKCYWCPSLEKCSTGTDRKRQEWLQKGCDQTMITEAAMCPAKGSKGNNQGAVQDVEIKHVTGSGEKYLTGPDLTLKNGPANNNIHISNAEPLAHVDSGGVGMVLGLFVPIILALTLVIWIFYAYRNPHTKSGQLLIQYRPSQWSWRRGEARYTAATIHM